MTEDRIKQALNRLFEKHRIVFWYDAKKELRADFESLQLDGRSWTPIDLPGT